MNQHIDESRSSQVIWVLVLRRVLAGTHVLQGWTDFPKLWKPLQNSRHLKSDIRQFHTEDPQMLGCTVQNSVARTTCYAEFLHL